MLSSAVVVVAALTFLSSQLEAKSVLPSGNVKKNDIEPLVNYGNANFAVDLMLFKINRALPDTIPLGDLGSPVNLKNCTFVGLDNGIHRDGPATLVHTAGEFKFAAELKMRELGLYCHWSYGLFRGKFTGISAQDDISSGFLLMAESGQHPWITEFRVSQLDPAQIDITGAPGFNWLAEDILQRIIDELGKELTYFIEHTIKNLVQDALNTLVIP